ncbi:MAG TPA: M56 family metallopeptidase, partial [Mucilaginibacter sp.]
MELHLTDLVSDQVIKALCNTLIHSLWQGIIMAVITGLTIILTKKSSAALRYNLLTGYLFLFAIAAAFTFFKQLHPSENIKVTATTVISPTPTLQMVTNHQQVRKTASDIISVCTGYFNTHADVIVLVWFLIICARSVQLAAGLQSVYYIKWNKVASAGVYLENRVSELARNMGIKSAVRILQSGIAQLPVVIGHFKPVILIPVGLLTALSTEEVESILVHELAHIRRKDFLVNLLQNLMEIIFFFNPAVLWVSALIKAERENCCDDMVIAHTSSKVSYIKALVSCEEYRSATPAYAMGLGGSNGHTLQRVKRMLSNNNQSLNRVEKMVLTVCLISAVLITAAFSNNKDHKIRRIKPANATAVPKIKNNEHRPLPANSVSNNNSTNNEQIVGYTAAVQNADTTKTKKQNHQVSDTSTSAQVARLQAQLTKMQIQHQIDSLNLSLAQHRGSDDHKPTVSYENGHPNTYDYDASRYKEYPAKAILIGDELVRENLVKDKTHYTYKLTNSELYIDGVLRSEELHRRIVDKYFKPGDNFNINHEYHDPGLNNGYNRAPSYPIHPSYTPESVRERALKDSIANATIAADLMKDGLITDPKNL